MLVTTDSYLYLRHWQHNISHRGVRFDLITGEIGRNCVSLMSWIVDAENAPVKLLICMCFPIMRSVAGWPLELPFVIH